MVVVMAVAAVAEQVVAVAEQAAVAVTAAVLAVLDMEATVPGIQPAPPTMAAPKARRRIMPAGPFGITA
jgi:hypothetical protein